MAWWSHNGLQFGEATDMSPELFLFIWISTLIIFYGVIVLIAGLWWICGRVALLWGRKWREEAVVKAENDKREDFE